MIAISICIFAALVAGITALGYRVYGRSGRIHERLGEAVLEAPSLETISRPEDKKWMVRIVQKIGEKVPINPQDAGVVRRYLIAAGYRSDTAIRVFYGVKIVAAVALFGVAVVAYPKISGQVMAIAALVAAPAAGYFGPNMFLEKLIDRRRLRLRLALPDALDLMVVCMEAGLGLDQAISNVSRELARTHPEISSELGLVTLEMRAGKRRGEALKNLADRTAEPDLKKLVATMIQADRFGTSISEALRTHSDFMRVRRRQDAEERAAKVGVKLVFPIFFFILPAMLVVAAGPGILAMFKGLFPLMKGFQG